jgi:hypothetical protein
MADAGVATGPAERLLDAIEELLGPMISEDDYALWHRLTDAIHEALETARPVDLEERQAAVLAPPDELQREALAGWKLLVEVLAAGGAVHLSQTDPDDEGRASYAMVLRGEGGSPSAAVRRDLLEALRAAAGREVRKRCQRCKESKPLSEFGRLRKKPDGHNEYCLVCERTRIQAYNRARGNPAKPAAVDDVKSTAAGSSFDSPVIT